MTCEQKHTKERGAVAKTGNLFPAVRESSICGQDMIPIGPPDAILGYVCPGCGSDFKRCVACGTLLRNLEGHFATSAACGSHGWNRPHRNLITRGAKLVTAKRWR